MHMYHNYKEKWQQRGDQLPQAKKSFKMFLEERAYEFKKNYGTTLPIQIKVWFNPSIIQQGPWSN